MNLVLCDNIIRVSDDESVILTAKDIIALEEGTNELGIGSFSCFHEEPRTYAGRTEESKIDLIPKPSILFPNIDFVSFGFVLSSVKAFVFVPTDKSNKRPRLVYRIIDSDYKNHEIININCIIDYAIIDNIFCVLDQDQVLELKHLFGNRLSGPLEFSLIASLLEKQSQLVEFIYDDDQCINFDSIFVNSANKEYPLYSYQQRGATWINSVVDEGVGCVLADEMGLGKTPQVISVLTSQSVKGTSLVIVPNSLKENWRREINKFSPLLTVLVYGGQNRSLNYKNLTLFNVVITSYDTACNDFSIIKQIKWNLIVLDEAQAIKNAGTKRSSYIRSFPKRAGLAVSGTPFENHVEDVWSIFDFCFSGLLGTLSQYRNRFSDTEDSAKQIESIISPLLLRRRTSEVKKELPSKVIIDKVIEMDSNEAELYENIRKKTATQNGKPSLGTLQVLRQYCALPSIICNELKNELPTDMSQKFNYLLDILNNIYHNHEKVLIFTSWRPAHDAIKEAIENIYGSQCFVLNGSIPQDERQTVVDDFSMANGFSAMILNPEVGGTGLNITAANHVVFYTLEWNPSLEDQCIGRVARIGQTKTVMVYRLFYSNTIEDVINERLKRKRTLRELIVQGTDGEDEADIMKALSVSPFSGGKKID